MNFFDIVIRSFISTTLLFVVFLVVSCKSEVEEPQLNSEYITEVFEYVYAPGQHAKLAKPSDTQFFIGNPASHSGWVYLGGFGGYIVAGFDHDVQNIEGVDFEVFSLKGAMPEPAVVYVMQDRNGDGLPNEDWYELKGNQFENSKRNFRVTYYKATSESSNIIWLDSDGNRGELISGFNGKYSSVWWWTATLTDSITFTGTRLPDSYDNQSVGENELWTVPNNRFTWGYAENNFGTDYNALSGSNRLDISNAVDSLGNAVHLPSIRFIKVQTAVFQQAGWTNEVSSELRGARELKNGE